MSNLKTIKTYRKSLGLTQNELAEKLDVSGNTVWRWENNHAQPKSYVFAFLDQLAAQAAPPGSDSSLSV